MCVCLTEPTAVARHDHKRAQASSDDALRPSQWWLFKGACVLVEERVDTVGRRRTSIPHYGLCGSRHSYKMATKTYYMDVDAQCFGRLSI